MFTPTIQKIALWFVCLLAWVAMPSCNTFIGKAYENTTGRYNSYFLAKEKMKEVDAALKIYAKDDYHKVLNIHYYSDSLFGKSQNAALETVFKYASWSVRWHKRSKWADNNYILIGKVRQYQYNYKDGLETFKFVNSTSPSARERHEALIQLMHFFTDFGEMDNVKYVIDFLDQEKEMTKKNRRDYLVAKASYFQITKDYKKVHELLDTVLPLCRRKHDKAKLSFINGQALEKLKEEAAEHNQSLAFDADQEATKNYKLTIKANPKYELLFNAKMNLMRVKKHNGFEDLNKARKYYHTMLADLKNAEFKDRIYYDFANFERKQKEYIKAEEYFKKSAKFATTNTRQKAYTYLATGEMYYDELERFEDAKLYYDSAISFLPKDHKNYGRIYRRQRILKDFVEHLTTVRLEDSLQKLAKMEPAQLGQFMDEYIAKEEKRLNDEAKRLAKLAKKSENVQSPFKDEFAMNDPNAAAGANNNTPAGFNTGSQATVFYFYNKNFAAQGKIEFQQKWGRRRLEDFWRISNKEAEYSERAENQMEATDTTKVLASGGKNTDKEGKPSAKEEKDDLKEIKIDKEELLAKLPLSPQKIQASNDRLQKSIFRLGKIYNQHLNEPDNSIKSMERLIHEFPENENVPEAHYTIYLICKGKDSAKAQIHKNILLDNYPQSLYAKILKNPNYLTENKIQNQQIMARYRVAYQVYAAKNYKEADSLFALIQQDYPESEYDQKIELVRSIMKARSGRREDYRSELQTFLDKHPKGSYHDYAKALIDRYEGRIPQKTTPDGEETPKVEPSNNQDEAPDPGYLPMQPDPSQPPIPEEIQKLINEQKRKIKSDSGPVPPAPVHEPLQEPRKGF